VPQPDPIYSDEAVVALCMNALGRNDDPIPDAGLRTCWNFSSDMCRAAVGGSLADFLKYARNPTFAQLVDHESWSGKLGNRIPATMTRGALTTTMVTVQTNRGQERKFLWTLVPARKSTSELGLQTPLWRQHRVDGVGRLNLSFHTGCNNSAAPQTRAAGSCTSACTWRTRSSKPCSVITTVTLSPPPDAREELAAQAEGVARDVRGQRLERDPEGVRVTRCAL
jgi:hypothetical protein